MEKSDPVQLYKRLLAAMRSEDDKAALPLFAPDFVAYEDPGMGYGGTYHGGEGFWRLRRKVYDIWGPGAMNLLYVCGEPDGDHASAHFRLSGRPNGGRAIVEGHVAIAWTFRDGLAAEARVFYYDTPSLNRALS